MRTYKFSDVGALAAALLLSASPASSSPVRRGNSQNVGTNGVQFQLNGQPFNFAGTNNYDTAFVDTQHISDILTAVKNDGYKVLRTWAFNELDTQDSYQPPVYFQSWTDGVPTINIGANGLGLLDEVVSQAETAGLKLILTLANNWADYGGMDVYVNQVISDNPAHGDFYTNPTIVGYFKDYVETIVTKHKDSPAIFSWELANEARCTGTNSSMATTDCTADTITKWTDMMSAHIKKFDPNHMVSIGIEGYFNHPGATTYEYDGSQGQDFDAILKLDNIDFGTIHIYIPQDPDEDEAWSLQYLKDHDASGQAANKPVVLEEYGVDRDGSLNRTEVYDAWRDYIYGSKAINGDMSWATIQLDNCPNGNEYAICSTDPDYDELVTDWVKKMNGKA
ncbi:MAG: accessory factor associated with RNA polymerase II [Chaenotheca gracillima]|nr:MAG: accessory factor associated with RNA polymerase II [Chaenotheca gracillima]